MTSSDRKTLQEYGNEILEQLNLQRLMDLLDLDGEEVQYSLQSVIQILKYFVLNLQEKEYLERILKETIQNESLQLKLQDLTMEQEKENKERAAIKADKNLNIKKLTKEIESYENKLEKTHQKLNQTIFHNNQLRQKIDLLRKEKNIIEEIYVSLRNELQKKKDSIEQTIIEAGRAHINRNFAEKELSELIDKAQEQKQQFEKEYETLNKEI